MKHILTHFAVFFFCIHAFSQTSDETPKTSNQLRINFINPAVEIEQTIGNKSTVSAGIGVGYGGGYPDLTIGGSGFINIVTPFLDVQYKRFTNLKKRNARGKATANNSGNFLSIRLLTRGASISENVERTSDYDFAIGPTWGLQRTLGEKIHLLFDLGPVYYFDTNGTGNVFPLILQLNIGYNLK